MVAAHCDISVEDVVLMINEYQILYSSTELHMLFYPPIILHIHGRSQGRFLICGGLRSHLLTSFKKCNDPTCELRIKERDDLIIKQMISARNDTREVIIKVFSIADEIKKEIEENSEGDHIRCMDVMHHMYYNNDDLTWELVETKVRREDLHLVHIVLCTSVII